MATVRSLVAVLVILSSYALTPVSVNGQVENQRVKIGYAALSPVMAGLWMAKEIGAFEKHGLKPELIYISSGATVIQALVGGDLEMAVAASNAVVGAVLRGAPIVAVGSVANRPAMRLWVQSYITTPEQLQGKTLAISRPGSTTDFLTKVVLEKYNLKGKVKIQSFPSHGGDVAFKAGLIAGRITSTKPSPSARVLVDLADLEIPYSMDYLAVSRDYYKKHPKAVEAMLKAYVEGVAGLSMRKQQALDVLGKYLGLRDVSHLSLQEIYDSDIKMIERDGRVDPRTVQTVLDWIGKSDVAPAKFFDNSILDRVVGEGFIDNLHRPQK